MGSRVVALFSRFSNPALAAPVGRVTLLQAASLADLPVERLSPPCPRFRSGFLPSVSRRRSPMPAITLPDGSIRRFEGAVTGTEIAAAIGPGLARAALAMKVDGQGRRFVAHDRSRRRCGGSLPARRGGAGDDPARCGACAAEAVQALYPGTQVTIGPSIENGFYYDFARNEPFTPEDFPAIEARCGRSWRATPLSCARNGIATTLSRSSRRAASATRRS